jgi:acid phosphatase (class A)
MMSFSNKGFCQLLPALIFTATITSCVSNAWRDEAAILPAELRTSQVEGYLQSSVLPNSLALLPPPPIAGSTGFALDVEYSKKSFALRDTPAWTLAILDADLTFPNAAGTYSCALNAPINEQDTPHLYTLLRRTLKDAKDSTEDAKKHYQRLRPFLVNKAAFCTPEDKARLEKSSSYPSGHNAVGMAWALVITEISPAQTDSILARGQAFGVSRIVCNVHWNSDTLQGRYMGAYTVARLHANPAFRADLEAAKVELETVRAKGLKPTRDCNAEKAGMDLQKLLYQ